VVRASAPEEAMTAALRAQVYALDHDLSVYNICQMEQCCTSQEMTSQF